MISRFNYTDRQKIPRERVRLTWIDRPGEPLRFTVDMDLALERPLDPAGLVFVEAYSGPVVMRFDFGTVGHPEQPAELILHDFPPGLKPLFRVKVVDPGTDRRLLAWANEISPVGPEEVDSGRRSILEVETVPLEGRIWNLRKEGTSFRLQLNSAIREPRDITVIAREPDFVALVYPAVIRQILETLLLGPDAEPVEEDHDWLQFAAQLSGRSVPAHDEDNPEEGGEFEEQVEDWINEVVIAFCQQQHAVESFIEFKKGEEINA